LKGDDYETDFEDEELKVETSKLVASDNEQNQGDDELSTLSNTQWYKDLDDHFLSSDEEEDLDDSFTKPSPKKNQQSNEKPKKKLGVNGDKSPIRTKELKQVKKKSIRSNVQLFLQRDIAEGRPFNNSFTGPYPDDNDHLHKDTGPNPQFQFFD